MINNNFIVTGSNGLLGSAVKKQITEPGSVFLTRQDVDLSIKEDLSKVIQLNTQCNSFIHCAAKVGGVGANMNDNYGFFNENIRIDQNVLNACLENNIENLVTILSTCVFPDKVEYPLTYEKIDLGPPHNSNYGYSYAKRMLYYSTKMYRNFSKKNWISIIPTNLYGPNDNFNLESSHLVPALIRKAHEASLSGNDFIVWGDGSPLRQFVFSEDMAKIILWAVENWKNDNPLMAINEKEYSIKQVAYIIADRFNIPSEKIIFDTSKPNGQFRKPAKSDINDFNFISLEDGLNKTIDWFLNNQEKIRK